MGMQKHLKIYNSAPKKWKISYLLQENKKEIEGGKRGLRKQSDLEEDQNTLRTTPRA